MKPVVAAIFANFAFGVVETLIIVSFDGFWKLACTVALILFSHWLIYRLTPWVRSDSSQREFDSEGEIRGHP